MNRKSKIILILIAGTYTSLANSQNPVYDYRCLSNKSDYVFVANVESISKSPLLYDYMGGLWMVSLSVKEQLKGNVSVNMQRSESMQLLWRAKDAHSPRFVQGKSYLLFIENSEAGPVVLNGSQGAVSFYQNKVNLHGVDLSMRALSKYVNDQKNNNLKCEFF